MDLPTINRKPEKYIPIPYTFRFPNNVSITKKNTVIAGCPPFYVQLDHALAVVWTLFSKDATDKPLGVVQIQWALNFVKEIRNQQGEYPKDISLCIEAMEDALIEQYANMANSVVVHPDFIKKQDSMLGESSHVQKSLSETDKGYIVKQSGPFSMNYIEMIKCKSKYSKKVVCILENTDMDDDKDKEASKDNMVDFLKGFRKEQINKIQEELKRLHCIDSYIGNIERDNCNPN